MKLLNGAALAGLVFCLVACGGNEERGDYVSAEYEQAKMRWEAQGVDNYRLELSASGGTSSLNIIYASKLSSAYKSPSDSASRPYSEVNSDYPFTLTIEQLFQFVQDLSAGNELAGMVTYNVEYGYPELVDYFDNSGALVQLQVLQFYSPESDIQRLQDNKATWLAGNNGNYHMTMKQFCGICDVQPDVHSDVADFTNVSLMFDGNGSGNLPLSGYPTTISAFFDRVISAASNLESELSYQLHADGYIKAYSSRTPFGTNDGGGSLEVLSLTRSP